eukprot:1162041-Pelagomonas_calceolata.AAC.6
MAECRRPLNASAYLRARVVYRLRLRNLTHTSLVQDTAENMTSACLYGACTTQAGNGLFVATALELGRCLVLFLFNYQLLPASRSAPSA